MRSSVGSRGGKSSYGFMASLVVILIGASKFFSLFLIFLFSEIDGLGPLLLAIGDVRLLLRAVAVPVRPAAQRAGRRLLLVLRVGGRRSHAGGFLFFYFVCFMFLC